MGVVEGVGMSLELGAVFCSLPRFQGNLYEPRRKKTFSLGFPTRSDKNWPGQSQKKARSLKE